MPAIAGAAHDGALSWDQLRAAVEVATPATDAEWAKRAPNTAPADLQRQARAAKTVTPKTPRRGAKRASCAAGPSPRPGWSPGASASPTSTACW